MKLLRSCYALLSISLLFGSSQAFVFHPSRLHRGNIVNTQINLKKSSETTASSSTNGGKNLRSSSQNKVSKFRKVPQSSEVFVDEFFTPAKADWFSIAIKLVGESFLVNVALISIFMYSFFGTQNIGVKLMSFDPTNMTTALMFVIPLITASLFFYYLPFPISKEMTHDNRFFALRLFGRQSTVFTSFVLSLLVGATAGFSEEFFFRGLVFNSIENASNNFPLALSISSAIFGLAHYPLKNANAIVEAFLGGVLGYAYYYTGYNLAVPIAIRTIYDFVTLFFFWYVARNDLNRKMYTAVTGQGERTEELSSFELGKLSMAIFETLDFDKDGFINLKELQSGLQMFGHGHMLPLNADKEMKLIFALADTNKDGRIDLQEFKAVVKQDLEAVWKWKL